MAGLAVTTGHADPSPPRSRIETILLATDLSRSSSRAVDQAIDLARVLNARLLIVNVVDAHRGLPIGGIGKIRPVEERQARSVVAGDLAHRARAAGADATFLLFDGDAADGILSAAEAEDADLIIVGTRGRSGVERSLLGSVSDQVVRRSRCPVLVVRPVDDPPLP
jgi:nucleotide-binding universal stress UspA family protein